MTTVHSPVVHDEEPAGTWTRSQLLEMRGYDPAVINGNGHAPAEVSHLLADTRNAPPATPARTCAGCSTPLTGQQQKWCSMKCKRRAEPRPVRRGQDAKQLPSRAGEAPLNGRVRDDLAAANSSDPGLFDMVAALAGLLPAGWRASVGSGTVTLSWSSEGGQGWSQS